MVHGSCHKVGHSDVKVKRRSVCEPLLMFKSPNTPHTPGTEEDKQTILYTSF